VRSRTAHGEGRSHAETVTRDWPASAGPLEQLRVEAKLMHQCAVRTVHVCAELVCSCCALKVLSPLGISERSRGGQPMFEVEL
jgi:hypothetical protein